MSKLLKVDRKIGGYPAAIHTWVVGILEEEESEMSWWPLILTLHYDG